MAGLLSLAGVISGAGEGAGKAIQTGQVYWTQSMLMEERAKMEALRDERMEGYASGREARQYEHAENLQKQGFEHTEKQTDKTIAAQDKLQENRLTAESVQKEIEGVREDIHAYDDRQARKDLAKLQQDLENKAPISKLNERIKKLELNNVERVEELRKDYHNPKTPAERRKSIAEEISLLTGKDNDSFIPVATGFDEATGKPNAYKIFDKKRGVFVEPPKAQPTRADFDSYFQKPNREAADQAWRAMFGTEPPKKVDPEQPAPPPPSSQPPSEPLLSRIPETPYEPYWLQQLKRQHATSGPGGSVTLPPQQ